MKNHCTSHLILLLFLAMSVPVRSEEGLKTWQTKPMLAAKASSPIVIDGKLDESEWQKAEPYYMSFHDGSIDLNIRDMQTCVRLLWDDKALYVAFSCQDKDIYGYRKTRDSEIFWENSCELILAPMKKTEYWELTINPLGTIYDAHIYFDSLNKLHLDPSCDMEVKAAVSIEGTLNEDKDIDTGWIVELAIPWNQMDSGTIESRKKIYGNFLRFVYSRIKGETGPQVRQPNPGNAGRYFFLNVFPTQIKQWPHSPGTFGEIILQ